MVTFKLTRIDMTRLLYSLKGEGDLTPLQLLKLSVKNGKDHYDELKIPSFFEKLERRKQKSEHGLSTNEIVELGNLCELTSLKSTAIQNWIKRDIKDMIGHPELGKKYSIDQVVILLIVRDLKSVFDFDTIRMILSALFNTITDRTDDIISPIRFYEAYAHVLDFIYHHTQFPLKETNLREITEEQTDKLHDEFTELAKSQWHLIKGIISSTVFSVFTSHLQSTAQEMMYNTLQLNKG
ncbi:MULTISPECIES: DUF1836 domain-containing protein [Bacillus]|uniref:DUF1836 domain-containing protein n=1 Tax=Bacillus TaxID=1386 RepID=UPI00059791B6|nr:DUF1836 domain-containing protein [Bacillus safensis]APT49292.1 hypothetical protein BSA41_04820 [Bacillus safensis]APT54431.1 hypothetical protein BSA171_12895 [Bacillus safensis]KIL18554.1 hypothetical protein B4129_1611 [Bacillus safensis]CUB19747.1 hypothetical protein BN2127_JRS3_02012 [Bacillus safensis]